MADKNENVIQLVELSKIYKDFWGRPRVKALDGLNLEVKQGEVFGLLGPNGSGKTTTVRLILGLLFPTKGAVRIFGKSPREVKIKKRVGYMPEESNLYEYLNAEETLDFFGRLFRLDGDVRQHRVDQLIDMVGLQRARRRPVGEFSKGMARRIGLAQALINDPDLLILDEPTTGLDPIGGHEIKDLISTLKDRGKTIFICSHLLADVEEICDRICILYGGRNRSMGEVKDLLTEGEVTEIRAPRLPEPVVEKLRQIISEHAGDDSQVQVGSPSRRLEEYFLEVVKQARREKLATAGAEAGGEAADFLAREEEGGEKLVEDLVSAGKDEEEAEEEEEAEAPEPQEAAPSHDEHMLSDLVSEDEEGTEETADDEEEEAEPVEPEEVRKDVIEQLEDREEDEGDEREKDE